MLNTDGLKHASLMTDFIKEAAQLQDDMVSLKNSKEFTKKNLCDLCCPFRDKYHLTDLQTLAIARKELSLSQIIELGPQV